MASIEILATFGRIVTPNPFLGLIFHWIGGFASASFYIPYRGVKKMGLGDLLAGGRIFQLDHRSVVFGALHDARFVGRHQRGLGLDPVLDLPLRCPLGFWRTHLWPDHALSWPVARNGDRSRFLRGLRHVDPADFSWRIFYTRILGTTSGVVILLGVGVCLLGIAVSGAAGMTKEKEMSEEQKRAAIKEFDFQEGHPRGDIFPGVMSACFSFGLDAGKPIKADYASTWNDNALWQGLPVLVVILLGGFTTNFIWCVYLNRVNRTGAPVFFIARDRILAQVICHSGNGHRSAGRRDGPSGASGIGAPGKPPRFRSSPIISFARWRARFGTSNFSSTPWAKARWSNTRSRSWTLHMASIITFGNPLGDRLS